MDQGFRNLAEVGANEWKMMNILHFLLQNWNTGHFIGIYLFNSGKLVMREDYSSEKPRSE